MKKSWIVVAALVAAPAAWADEAAPAGWTGRADLGFFSVLAGAGSLPAAGLSNHSK